MSTTVTNGDRIYAGRTGDERRADRRTRLLEAGLQVFGTEGYMAGTADRLCREAGVSPRHFYEHFSSRDELLGALFDKIMGEAMDAVRVALDKADLSLEDRVTAGIGAYLDRWIDDPRRAVVACIDMTSINSVLTENRRRAKHAFAQVITAQALAMGIDMGEPIQGLVSLALVGAVNELLFDWVLSLPDRPTSRDDISFVLTQMLVASAVIRSPEN